MKQSAGLLVYRRQGTSIEVLIVHPGGPFWAKKDEGAWSIPKGEFEEGNDPLQAAKREFQEETGQPAPEGDYLDLDTAKNKSGKVIYAWAVEGDFDIAGLQSNTFSMEWPPKSGQQQDYPEVDKAVWLTPEKAMAKLNPAQVIFAERLSERLHIEPPKIQEQTTLL